MRADDPEKTRRNFSIASTNQVIKNGFGIGFAAIGSQQERPDFHNGAKKYPCFFTKSKTPGDMPRGSVDRELNDRSYFKGTA